MTCERVADLLDPYLDGEADALTARAVEEHLGECGACSRRLAARRALQTALREKLPYFRAPEALRRGPATAERAVAIAPVEPASALRIGPDSGTPAVGLARPRRMRYAAAAALLLTGGIGVGLALRPAGPDPLNAIVAAVETDHVRSLQEHHLLDVISTDQHTVKPWFAGRIPFAPPVPDPPGFPLQGGRLDWVDGRQAAALVYARNKHTINLLVWPAGSAVLPAVPTARTTAGGHHALMWSRGELNFCAISDVESGQLAEFVAEYRAAE